MMQKLSTAAFGVTKAAVSSVQATVGTVRGIGGSTFDSGTSSNTLKATQPLTHRLWITKAPAAYCPSASERVGAFVDGESTQNVKIKYNVHLPEAIQKLWPFSKVDSEVKATVQPVENQSGITSFTINPMKSNQNVQLDLKMTSGQAREYTVRVKRCDGCDKERLPMCIHNAILVAIKRGGTVQVTPIGLSTLQTAKGDQFIKGNGNPIQFSAANVIHFVLRGECLVKDDGIDPASKLAQEFSFR
jgi:hypothetical protein